MARYPRFAALLRLMPLCGPRSETKLKDCLHQTGRHGADRRPGFTTVRRKTTHGILVQLKESGHNLMKPILSRRLPVFTICR